MYFSELSVYLSRLEATSSRIGITKILSQIFKRAKKEEIDKIVYLVLGCLAPSYEGKVFNIAERMMLDVLSIAYGENKEKVNKLYKEKGDLGDVANMLAHNLQPTAHNSRLSASLVYRKLKDIAEDEGEGSQERKVSEMARTLSELDDLSVKYVSRIPVGRLRLGFSDKTVIDALSWMEVGDKSKSATLEKAYQVVPDVGLLARRVKELGIDKASVGIKPEVGVPVLPMLAQRLKSPKEMIKKMGKVYVEPKFDGLRVLVHFKRTRTGSIPGQVWAFTRNLNNVIDMFPELKEIGKYLNANEVILDTEAVGMDPEMLKIANFQTTMQRRRKYDIDTKSKEIPLKFQVFDIVLKDGKSLMATPYHNRREILEKTVIDGSLLLLDEALLTEDPKVITREHKRKLAEGLEGVIIKKWDTEYIPGRTGWRWVKMKEEESSVGKLADTVDCIVMGYSAGRGKRVSFGLGQFLVGIRDNDEIKTVTKVGTGLTDEQFRELKKRLKGFETSVKPKNYLVNKLLEPDFWVMPHVVVEIAADEITKSPTHSAGLALRFPRLIKFRDDKALDQSTTIDELRKLFKLQKVN